MSDMNCYKENPVFTTIIEDIENDIYYDINDLLCNNKLYSRYKFKDHGHAIDIFYPQYSFPEFKAQYKGPDSIRFLLSLYPVKEDFKKVRKIILRPRHIELDNTELISLYICKEKTIVLYLYYPYSYTISNSIVKFNGFLNRNVLGFNEILKSIGINADLKSIPPLWYILSTISCDCDDKIEKFLVKRRANPSGAVLSKLYELSFQYSRLGY